MDDHTVTGRVVAVLDAVGGLGGGATLAAVTRACGIPKPTVRRIAADLVGRGLLERRADGYRLGPRLLVLGDEAGRQQGLRQAATPYVQDLFARTGEIAWITAITDTTLVLLHCVFGTNRAADVRSGGFPTAIPSARFLVTAAGRIVLGDRPELADHVRHRRLPRLTPYTVTQWPKVRAAIDAARDENVAVESEQSLLGYDCLAAGVHGPDGRVIAVVGITGRTGTLAAGRLARPVLAAASDIRRTLQRESRVTG